MQTTITARHCEISDTLRERARHGRRAAGHAGPSPDRVGRRVRHRGQAGHGRAPAARVARRACWWPAARPTITAPRWTAPRRSSAASSTRRRPAVAPLARRRAPDRLMLRLRDFVSRRGDPLQLEALTGELGLDRQMPDAEVASPGLALAGYTGRFAPEPHPRVRRDRDHLPQLALARGAAGDAAQVLRLRPALHLRHQGAGGAARDARAGARAERAGLPLQAQDGGVLPPDQADGRGGVRARGPRCTARSPTSTASACSSSAGPASARASACSTWSSAATGWWPTTWCRSPGAATTCSSAGATSWPRTTWRSAASA